MDERVRFGRSQATALLRSIGIQGPVTVSVIHKFNHVYRLQAGEQVFFLKTHTKAWYRGDALAPARCVIQEQCAWDILAGHGVPTPEVVLVASEGAFHQRGWRHSRGGDPAGAVWRPAETHAVDNIGTTDIRAVAVELK